MKACLVGPLVAFVLALAALDTLAVDGDVKVTLCKYCNSSAFSNAAETATMRQAPRLEEGRQFVFVVDVGTDEIRYYEVVREYVQICRDDAAAATQSGAIINPDDPGPTFPDCFSNWLTSSTQLPAPADAVAELREARREVDKFAAAVQDFDLGELGLGPIPIDSATDLIGPVAGPPNPHNPAFMRAALQNAVANQYFDTWLDRAFSEIGDLAIRFANMFITDPSITTISSTTVHFPDGTTIELVITTIVRDEFGGFKTVRVKVDTASAQGQNLPWIPTESGDFLSFFRNGFTGNPLFLNNLGDLIVRGGGRVDRSRSGGSCNAFMQCEDAGVDANGNPLVECRLVLPKEELRC